MLQPAQWVSADPVEVRFRSSKGDQFRKGAVVTRTRSGASRRVEAGGGAVDLMVELLSFYTFLPSCAPLVAFGVGHGRWAIWTKQQATTTLCQVIALAGLQPEEYALHSLQIGGATYLAMGGASPDVFRPEGRWAGESSSHQPYIRDVGGHADWVSSVLQTAGVELQPGQGMKWDHV